MEDIMIVPSWCAAERVIRISDQMDYSGGRWRDYYAVARSEDCEEHVEEYANTIVNHYFYDDGSSIRICVHYFADGAVRHMLFVHDANMQNLTIREW